jgi:malate dehydrogenase
MGEAAADADDAASQGYVSRRFTGAHRVPVGILNPATTAGTMFEKITVVGAGNVGATAAQRIAEKHLARTVVMVDVAEGIPEGKALDQWQSAPVEGFDSRVIGASDYSLSHDSELFVVTAGIARKPGMSRDDLVRTNAGIVQSVGEQIKQVAPKAIVIVVSNPLDVMCFVMRRATGFPKERVLGMAGVLDTARYRTFLSEAMGISVADIQAMVLGGHGDTMVPLISYTTVSGIPVSQLVDKATLDAIVARARNGGAEIVAHLKTGSAYYAPSAAAVQMVEAIVHDRKRLLPASAWLEGEFGLHDVYCGVPCLLGRTGLERVVEITLSDEERAALHASAEAVRTVQATV